MLQAAQVLSEVGESTIVGWGANFRGTSDGLVLSDSEGAAARSALSAAFSALSAAFSAFSTAAVNFVLSSVFWSAQRVRETAQPDLPGLVSPFCLLTVFCCCGVLAGFFMAVAGLLDLMAIASSELQRLKSKVQQNPLAAMHIETAAAKQQRISKCSCKIGFLALVVALKNMHIWVSGTVERQYIFCNGCLNCISKRVEAYKATSSNNRCIKRSDSHLATKVMHTSEKLFGSCL